MSTDMQTTINRLSLVMTIPEDIVKACKRNELSPEFTEVLIRIHSQQVELEKSVNTLRTTMVEMAKVIEQQSSTAINLHNALMAMSKEIGMGDDEMVSSEAIKPE